MTNPALGTKRTCPKCSANFYDLRKSPAICPKCKHEFVPASDGRAARKKPVKSIAQESTVKLSKPKKDASQSKKKVSHADDDGSHDIEEIDGLNDVDDVDEITELEEAEDEQLAEDDADDETIIEELETGDKKLVDTVEEEEAEALVEEIEEERSNDIKSNNKKS